MTTTTRLFRLPQSKPSLSSWQRFKRSVKKRMFHAALESPFLQFICCLGGVEEARDLALDEEVRESIRESMHYHGGFGRSETCLENTIAEVYRETGYSLTAIDDDIGQVPNIINPRVGFDQYMRWTMDRMLSPVSETQMVVHTPVVVPPRNEPPDGRVRIVPKFAAACALQLRAKLGVLSHSEANVLLAQRKYLEICRIIKVRDVDIVMHQQFVMNAMFGESELDRVATVRRRLPKWVKWLNDVQPIQQLSPMAC